MQTLRVTIKFVGSYAYVDFHHRTRACPSYKKMALGFASQSRFVYSLRAAAPYGATALGLIYKMIDLKTIPCPMNAIPLLLVSALRADTDFV